MLWSICPPKGKQWHDCGCVMHVSCLLCGRLMQAAHLHAGVTLSSGLEVQTASTFLGKLCCEAAWCRPSTGSQQGSLRARCGRCWLPGRLWPHPSGPLWTPTGSQAAAAGRPAPAGTHQGQQPLCWQRAPQPRSQTARPHLTGYHLQQARRLCTLLVVVLHDTVAIRRRKTTCSQGSQGACSDKLTWHFKLAAGRSCCATCAHCNDMGAAPGLKVALPSMPCHTHIAKVAVHCRVSVKMMAGGHDATRICCSCWCRETVLTCPVQPSIGCAQMSLQQGSVCIRTHSFDELCHKLALISNLQPGLPGCLYRKGA